MNGERNDIVCAFIYLASKKHNKCPSQNITILFFFSYNGLVWRRSGGHGIVVTITPTNKCEINVDYARIEYL